MAVANRISSLQSKHADLDKAIRAAELSPGQDSLELTELKKQKLALKDEIERLVAA